VVSESALGRARTPASLLSYAWLQQYGLPTDALSVLHLLTPASDGANLTVTWESVVGRSYFLERSPDLSGARAFTRIASNVVGQANTTSYVDPNGVGVTT